MKQSVALAATGLFAALTSAIPLDRRAWEYVTETQLVMKTDWVVETVWVHADGSPYTAALAHTTPASPAVSHHVPVPSVAVASSTPVAVSAAAAAPTHIDIPQPKPATPTSVYHPPPPPPPPAPSTPAAPAPAPAPAPTPSTPTAPPPPSSGSGSSSLSGQTFTGQFTHYAVGLGSCGWTSTPDEDVVAIPVGQMDNGANPNDNPLCGQTVNISYGGKSKQAKIVDTCMGCPNDNLDMSNGLFAYFAPLGLGRVGGMTWSLAS